MIIHSFRYSTLKFRKGAALKKAAPDSTKKLSYVARPLDGIYFLYSVCLIRSKLLYLE